MLEKILRDIRNNFDVRITRSHKNKYAARKKIEDILKILKGRKKYLKLQ